MPFWVILQKNRPPTSPMGFNEWFPAAAPGMKTLLEGFGETIPIAIGLASGGHR